MTLGVLKSETKEAVTITAEEAQVIYDKIINDRMSETDLFKDGIPFEKSVLVRAEMKRLEADMLSKMPKATTETALKESMSSELLDTGVLVEDVRKWSDGNPDSTPNWADYKASFKTEE